MCSVASFRTLLETSGEGSCFVEYPFQMLSLQYIPSPQRHRVLNTHTKLQRVQTFAPLGLPSSIDHEHLMNEKLEDLEAI